MSERLISLLDKRDGLLRECRALENKLAGLDMAIRIVAEGMEASGIETEGHDRETGHGAKHESPTPKGDAQP